MITDIERIACEVMADMLGLDASQVSPESRGAQLIREGIRRFDALRVQAIEATPTEE